MGAGYLLPAFPGKSPTARPTARQWRAVTDQAILKGPIGSLDEDQSACALDWLRFAWGGQPTRWGPAQPECPAGTKSQSPANLDCATAFQKIARDCVTSIKAHHSGARAADAEAVHQIRVAITRLRAAVAFFGPIVVDAEWLRLKKEIAWLNVSLGAARDSDVSMEYARRKRYQAWAEREIGDDLDRRRVQDHRRLLRCLRSSRFQRSDRGDGRLGRRRAMAGALGTASAAPPRRQVAGCLLQT